MAFKINLTQMYWFKTFVMDQGKNL